MKTLLPILILVFMFFSCKTQKLDLETVPSLNLNKYTGTWYEIARLPNSFEKGLKCITAEYLLNDDGTVQVINRGVKIAKPNKQSEAVGKAIQPDLNDPGKLKVSFQWPFYGKYWVLKLSDSYAFSVVGSPSGKYLWILSRTPQLPEETLAELKIFCASLGFETDLLIYPDQVCN